MKEEKEIRKNLNILIIDLRYFHQKVITSILNKIFNFNIDEGEL